MLEFLTIVCFGSVFYAYFGYPLLLFVARPFVGPKLQLDNNKALTSVSVIITARNEEAVIKAKLENTIAAVKAFSFGKAEVLVASDHSEDATDDIVRSFASKGVRLIRTTERSGKENAQKEAVAEARGIIIIFTDAKTSLDSDALERFATYFSDSSVGAVSSNDKVETSEDGSSGEGFYVRYEMFLRRLESGFNSLVGLSGSCFAVRRELCDALRIDVPSDFALLIAAQRAGLRGIHAEDIVCSYKAVQTEEQEFQRKVRTVLRGITTLLSYPETMNPGLFGIFSLQIISHKLMRWLVPWFLLLGTIFVVPPASESFYYLCFFAVVVGFFSLAYRAHIMPALRQRWLYKIPLFFCVTNLAIAQAWVSYVKGNRSVQWDPSQR